LNKTKIYKACGLSGYQPFNTYLKTRFDQVEKEWVVSGVTSAPKTAHMGSKAVLRASDAAADRRGERDLEDAQARIKQLEERNATLQADLAQLRSKFRRIDEHLGLTGRLLPP
jgi:septal ring factor EnvC (AmiA/AmiB activator)